MEAIRNYIESNKERFLEELFGLIRIPSVSAMEASKPDMVRAAEYICNMLAGNGADRAEVYPTKGNPIVYGEKLIDSSLPTILVYGHYDVMPAEPLEQWHSPPFEPEIRDGKIWARGADDDKGQLFMHLKAFEIMNATGTLPCNVKFMIEGEEEAGSESIADFCSEYREMLASDVILVSDTTMISSDTPSITSGLRGLSYIQIEVEGPGRDLHSGLYGGAVVNPVNVICDIISGLKDGDGKITIPGFYDDVDVPSDAERAKMAERPFDPEAYKKAIGGGSPCIGKRFFNPGEPGNTADTGCQWNMGRLYRGRREDHPSGKGLCQNIHETSALPECRKDHSTGNQPYNIDSASRC